jgi:micrococcal nuclease
MRWLANAWRTASRNQRIAIVLASLIALGAVVNLGLNVQTQGQESAGATTAPTTGEPTAIEVGQSPESSLVTATRVPTLDIAPAPTSARTPEPTPQPTSAPTFALSFTSLTSPVSPGAFATAKVKTSAGAYCMIVVEYKSGPSSAAGLGPKDASSTGVASWTWKVGSRTTPGSWPVTVTCSDGTNEESVTKYLKVL